MTAFKSIALVGNARDVRVAECMQSLVGHFQLRGQSVLVDPDLGLEFPHGAVESCPETAFATRADLQAISTAWAHWAEDPNGWMVFPHGEILARG